MKRVLLIPCVGPKLEVRAAARDLYQGPLFSACLAYRDAIKPDGTHILSALHGLVDLDQQLDPYNVTLSKLDASGEKFDSSVRVLTGAEVRDWGHAVVVALSARYDLDQTEFICLADSTYLAPIVSVLRNVSTPLEGVALIDRPRALLELIEAS